MVFVSVMKPPAGTEKDLSYSTFLDQVEKRNVKSVVIRGTTIEGEYVNEKIRFKTIAPEHQGLIDELRDNGVQIAVEEPTDQPGWLLIVMNALPMILMLLVVFFVWRQVQIGAGKGMSFGKSRAKLLTESQHKITFADVAGIDEARAELEEIIDFLKDPKKFTKLGGRIPKGVLLVGSPVRSSFPNWQSETVRYDGFRWLLHWYGKQNRIALQSL